jgi:hypothetical protein
MILVSFTVIYACKAYSVKVNQKYPAVDCGALANSYGKNLKNYAIDEWTDYYRPEFYK